MTAPSATAAIALLPLVYLVTTPARADDATAPASALPAGWVQPELEPLREVPATPTCCGRDDACCIAQTLFDAGLHRSGRSVHTLSLSELPSAEVGKDEDPLHRLGVYDAYGAPLGSIRSEPPMGTVRIVPPGRAGDIELGDRSNFWVHTRMPFYRDAELESLGFGVEYTWNAPVPPVQDYAWRSIDSKNGAPLFLSAAGRLDRQRGQATVAHRIHSELADLADGLVFGFVSDTSGKRELHLVLPSGFSGFADPGVRVEMGLDGFFGRDPFTYAIVPVEPDGSASLAVRVSRFSLSRWKLVNPRLAERDADALVVVSVSQVHGEPSPTLVVAVVDEDE